MPLEHEYSIVADSTISSSPQLLSVLREERDSDASPQIKRPARTYGRRQEVSVPVEEAEIQSSFFSSSLSHRSTHHTAPPGLSEEIPPSSPLTQAADPEATTYENADGEIALTAPKKYEFSWRRQLREMEDDDDGVNPLAPASQVALAPTGFGRPFLLKDSFSSNKKSSETAETTPRLPSGSDDIFSDSLSQREQTSSHASSFHDSFVLSSPKVAPPTRKRLSKVVRDSDSEPEPKASSSTSPSSSQPLHNINTPKSRSLSTTPPTSDDEMAGKKLDKGKRKGIENTRDSVPPINLIEAPLSESRARASTKSGKAKVKPLSKKEEAEMMKERVRMSVGSNAAIAIRRPMAHKYTKKNLFANIGGSMLPSDPIEAYSSPPGRTRTTVHVGAASTVQNTRSSVPKMRSLPAPNDSDSDELPEVSDVIKQSEASSRREELKRMKHRLLEQQKKSPPQVHDLDDDDDDLEIVNPNPKTGVKEEENRRSAQKEHISRARQQQLRLAHVNPSKHKSNDLVGPSEVLRQTDRLDQASLSRLLAAQALKVAQAVGKEKAEHWEKHGGHVAVLQAPAAGLTTTLQSFAEKGLKVAETNGPDAMDLDADNDDDWDPTMRGSASPRALEDDDQGSEEENDENVPIEQDVDMAYAEEPDEDDTEQSKVRSTRRMVIASDSESEKDEKKPVASTSNPYRRATSSVDSIAEDEYDKENNDDLMYDHSDDKENTAVVRHNPLGRTRSIFDVGMPPSPSNDWSAQGYRSELNNEKEGNVRRPFQELLSDKSPSTQDQSSHLTQSFAAKLQQASPLPSTLARTPTLKSFLDSESAASKSFNGFSQFSEDGDLENIGQVSVLEPGFSDLFESGTEKQRSPSRVDKGKGKLTDDDDVFSEHVDARQLKRAGALDLTQDVSIALNLQPAFQVKDDLMRKADAIFEKEQAFVVESAIPKPNKKPELYVNDHGFLTQTKPTEGSPEIYRPPPTQEIYHSGSLGGSMLSPSEFHSRVPLRTLSMSSAYQPDSPTQQPLRRLRKAATPTPGFGSVPYSPSTTPPPRQNAFQALARGAAKAHKHAAPKLGLNLAEYLQDEAAESDDEDNAFGLATKKTADDEDGEDLDQTLTELMDDKEMDESAIAANLVLEKFQEQEQEQDKKDQELHEAAVAGLLRKKRTRGVGVDDSDEESDDEGNERARRAMKKLRTTDRGDIQALAANETTEAFAAVYNQSLKDEDDFAYLDAESNLDDLIAADHEAENNNSDGFEEEEQEEEPETISPQEIVRIARRMKEDGVEETGIDPEDVSWVDKDAEDDAPSIIKTVRARRPQRISQQDVDAMDMDGAMGRPFGKAEQLNSSSKQWYAQENKTRNAGTSRSVGGSAITGHARVKSKTGATTSRVEPQTTKGGKTSASAGPSRSIKPGRSLLSAIADKSCHFA